MIGVTSNGPKDFPRIAKEMGFSFGLRRGRVDWHKIGMLFARNVYVLLLNISRIFLKYGHFSYDGVNDQHMFTQQRFIAYCCNFILPPEAASCLTVPDI
jgi:hypothetical protein